MQTIRFYEQIGLLPPPARSAGNQRVYTESGAERLCFVRRRAALLRPPLP
ncbi:MAG: MerR family DNA-binding transcriptional regulator [Bacteroidota bacterium]